MKLKNIKFIKKKLRGAASSTIDTVMAITIGGIIMATVGGGYIYFVSMARGQEAKEQLKHIYDLQEIYFYSHAKYGSDLKEIKFEQAKLSNQGGQAHYSIEIVAASGNSFKARATAITDFDADGTFNVWEIDQEKNLAEVIED